MLKIIKLIKRFWLRFWQANLNLLLYFSGKTLKPKWIWFGVTDRCNSKCQHCQIWKKPPQGQELTLEEIKEALSDPLFNDVETIINSGGEAILRKDIVELIKLEHKLFPDASLDLSTNGILADRVLEVIKKIVIDEGIKINIGISLDGIGLKHDLIRGVTGNFEKVDYLLRQLVNLRINYPSKLSFVIGFTLSDKTIEDWQAVKNYAENLNIEFMMQWYNQSSFYDNESAKKVEQKKFIKAVACQPNTIVREKWLKLLHGQSIKFKCFAVETFFALRSDGNIVPCLSFWDDIIGHVRNNTPTEIWHSKKAAEIRKKVKQCPGCLNSWGVEWSISTSFYPRILFYLKHPAAIIERFYRRD